MNVGMLSNYLNKFSYESLVGYLGEPILNSMFEWSEPNKPVLSKGTLVNLILSIHGADILENKDFRKKLLLKLSEMDLKNLAISTKEKNMDSNEFANTVSNEPWKDSEHNRRLLKLLKIENYLFKSNNDELEFAEPISADERFYELLDYQYIIKQKVLNELNFKDRELCRVLVHMPTGTGKTKTAMHIITHNICFDLKKGGLVIWIAHTKELLMQAYSTFESVWKHLGDGDIMTYKLWGNMSDSNIGSSGVVFCGLQKLQAIEKNNKDLFEKLCKNCRLIVFDEAHKISAEKTRVTINKLMEKSEGMPDRSLIGLTATPGRRTDEAFENKYLANMFDRNIVTIEPKLINSLNLSKQQALNTPVTDDIIEYFQERRILAKIKKVELTYPNGLSASEMDEIKKIVKDSGYDFPEKVLLTIGRNRYRNRAIMEKLRELNLKGIPTILFGCGVEHCKILSAMLKLEDIPNSLVLGEMPAAERKKAIDRFKDRNDNTNIIINYDVLTTGFDSTNIKCVFITRPTQSVVLYSQMLGRGLRGPQMGGNEECLLVDVKDNLDAYNENLAFRHFNNYWKG